MPQPWRSNWPSHCDSISERWTLLTNAPWSRLYMSSTICYGCHKNESKASTFTKTYFYNYPLFSIYNNFTISRNGMMTHATLDIIKTLQLDKIVNCKEILNPSLILFIYLYAACGCLAAAFPVGMAVLLMKCPCYQHTGTHFANLRRTTGWINSNWY